MSEPSFNTNIAAIDLPLSPFLICVHVHQMCSPRTRPTARNSKWWNPPRDWPQGFVVPPQRRSRSKRLLDPGVRKAHGCFSVVSSVNPRLALRFRKVDQQDLRRLGRAEHMSGVAQELTKNGCLHFTGKTLEQLSIIALGGLPSRRCIYPTVRHKCSLRHSTITTHS